MAHSIISDEIKLVYQREYNQCRYNLYTKNSSLVSLNVIKCQHIYSISSIKEHVIRCKYVICPFKRGIPQQVFPEIKSGNVC